MYIVNRPIEKIKCHVSAQITHWVINKRSNEFLPITRLAHFNSLRKYGEYRVYCIIEELARENPQKFDLSPCGTQIRITRANPVVLVNTLLDDI
jgi:hypothetical protein